MKWTSATMDLPDIRIKSKQIRKIVPATYYKGPPDLQVRCVDGIVHCHRKILAAFSPHFCDMEREVRAIQIPHVPAESFNTIIRFHQTGDCILKRKSLESVLRGVKMLGFEELQAAIEKIIKTEAPGVFTVEEFVLGLRTSDSDEEEEEEDEEEESISEVVPEMMAVKPQIIEGIDPIEALGLQWGSVSSDSDDEEETANRNYDDDLDEAFDEVNDEEWTPEPNRPLPRIPRSDGSRQGLNLQRGPMPRWTKEEVQALKEIWPQFKYGRRRDMKGIADAMQARGFKCGIEQIRAKLYRLRRQERLRRK